MINVILNPQGYKKLNANMKHFKRPNHHVDLGYILCR